MYFGIDLTDEQIEEDRLASQQMYNFINDQVPPSNDLLNGDNMMEEELDANDNIDQDSEIINVPNGGSKQGLYFTTKELQSVFRNSKQILTKENIDAMKQMYHSLNDKLKFLQNNHSSIIEGNIMHQKDQFMDAINRGIKDIVEFSISNQLQDLMKTIQLLPQNKSLFINYLLEVLKESTEKNVRHLNKGDVVNKLFNFFNSGSLEQFKLGETIGMKISQFDEVLHHAAETVTFNSLNGIRINQEESPNQKNLEEYEESQNYHAVKQVVDFFQTQFQELCIVGEQSLGIAKTELENAEKILKVAFLKLKIIVSQEEDEHNRFYILQRAVEYKQCLHALEDCRLIIDLIGEKVSLPIIQELEVKVNTFNAETEQLLLFNYFFPYIIDSMIKEVCLPLLKKSVHILSTNELLAQEFYSKLEIICQHEKSNFPNEEDKDSILQKIDEIIQTNSIQEFEEEIKFFLKFTSWGQLLLFRLKKNMLPDNPNSNNNKLRMSLTLIDISYFILAESQQKMNQIKNKTTDLLNILIQAMKNKKQDNFFDMKESCISVIIVKKGELMNQSDVIQIEIISESVISIQIELFNAKTTKNNIRIKNEFYEVIQEIVKNSHNQKQFSCLATQLLFFLFEYDNKELNEISTQLVKDSFPEYVKMSLDYTEGALSLYKAAQDFKNINELIPAAGFKGQAVDFKEVPGENKQLSCMKIILDNQPVQIIVAKKKNIDALGNEIKLQNQISTLVIGNAFNQYFLTCIFDELQYFEEKKNQFLFKFCVFIKEKGIENKSNMVELTSKITEEFSEQQKKQSSNIISAQDQVQSSMMLFNNNNTKNTNPQINNNNGYQNISPNINAVQFKYLPLGLNSFVPNQPLLIPQNNQNNLHQQFQTNLTQQPSPLNQKFQQLAISEPSESQNMLEPTQQLEINTFNEIIQIVQQLEKQMAEASAGINVGNSQKISKSTRNQLLRIWKQIVHFQQDKGKILENIVISQDNHSELRILKEKAKETYNLLMNSFYQSIISLADNLDYKDSAREEGKEEMDLSKDAKKQKEELKQNKEKESSNYEVENPLITIQQHQNSYDIENPDIINKEIMMQEIQSLQEQIQIARKTYQEESYKLEEIKEQIKILEQAHETLKKTQVDSNPENVENLEEMNSFKDEYQQIGDSLILMNEEINSHEADNRQRIIEQTDNLNHQLSALEGQLADKTAILGNLAKEITLTQKEGDNLIETNQYLQKESADLKIQLNQLEKTINDKSIELENIKMDILIQQQTLDSIKKEQEDCVQKLNNDVQDKKQESDDIELQVPKQVDYIEQIKQQQPQPLDIINEPSVNFNQRMQKSVPGVVMEIPEMMAYNQQQMSISLVQSQSYSFGQQNSSRVVNEQNCLFSLNSSAEKGFSKNNFSFLLLFKAILQNKQSLKQFLVFFNKDKNVSLICDESEEKIQTQMEEFQSNSDKTKLAIVDSSQQAYVEIQKTKIAWFFNSLRMISNKEPNNDEFWKSELGNFLKTLTGSSPESDQLFKRVSLNFFTNDFSYYAWKLIDPCQPSDIFQFLITNDVISPVKVAFFNEKSQNQRVDLVYSEFNRSVQKKVLVMCFEQNAGTIFNYFLSKVNGVSMPLPVLQVIIQKTQAQDVRTSWNCNIQGDAIKIKNENDDNILIQKKNFLITEFPILIFEKSVNSENLEMNWERIINDSESYAKNINPMNYADEQC